MDASLLRDDDPWIGRVIANKVEVEARIGRGGMGAVYRARHLETGGPVAVKVLHPSAATKAQALRRFHLEAQNAASLQSVHTIRVSDFGIIDNSPFLIMEYLDGEPLNATLRREGALPWRRAAHITAQVCKSLWEAHEHPRRIIHRDIKPGNVFLLVQPGARDFVKVLDFGISRALDGDGADTRGPIGTPHAMAPEQWRGAHVDSRADLYAVGCLLYEMLAGVPPFDADPSAPPAAQVAELARQHCHVPPPPMPDAVLETVPPRLLALTMSLLAKAPDDRPSRASDVVANLEAIADEAGMSFEGPTARGLHSIVRDDPRGGGLGERTADDIAVATPSPTPETPRAGGPVLAPASAPSPDRPLPPAWRHARRWAVGAGAFVGLAVLAAVSLLPPDEAELRAILTDASRAAAERQQALASLVAMQRSTPLRLRGLALLDLDLRAIPLRLADVQGSDLTRAELLGVDLQGADLREAKFHHANLRGANMRGADLRGADLDGAVLTGSSLERSRYDESTKWPKGFDASTSGGVGPGARVGSVDLRGADLRRASLTEANLQGSRLADANLANGALRGANIRDADLSRAALVDADLRQADLRGADLRGADLRGANLERADLRGALFDAETRWPDGYRHQGSGAVGPDADLRREDLSGKDLRGVDLRGADVRQARLLGTDLRGARLERARLEGAQIDARTQLPSGLDAAAVGLVRADRPPAGSAAAAAAPPKPDVAVELAAPAAPALPAPAAAQVARSAEGSRPRVAPAKPAPTPGSTPPIGAAQADGRAPSGATPPAAPAATTVLLPALRPPPPRHPTLGYGGADLRGVDMSGESLDGVSLRLARYDAKTKWPPGFRAAQSGALGPGARLGAINLSGQRLVALDLRGADLRGADLRGAQLPATQLDGASLGGARLHGADLSTARLGSARLQGARYDSATQWPAGFEPSERGAELDF